jgi:L-ascorbate metabolism protein UlaG (beta-lactamase superfamily)
MMDAPSIAARSGAPVFASVQGCVLLASLGVPLAQMQVLAPGDRFAVGPFNVETFPSRHRTILGNIPARGPLRVDLQSPLKAADYRIDRQFTFRVTVYGVRVLVVSGIDEEPAAACDVLLIGADGGGRLLAHITAPGAPRLVMPNHWDDMFRPLDRPTRPTIKPPRRFSLPRRIDMGGWQRMVEETLPEAIVVIPDLFEDIDLSYLCV